MAHNVEIHGGILVHRMVLADDGFKNLPKETPLLRLDDKVVGSTKVIIHHYVVYVDIFQFSGRHLSILY